MSIRKRKQVNFFDEFVLDQNGLHCLNNGEQITLLKKERIAHSSFNSNELVVQFNEQQESHALDLIEIRFQAVGQQATESLEKISEQMKIGLSLQANEEEILVSVPDISLYQPRGKYSITFYLSYMKLHGMSFSFNILYDSVQSAFLLPQSDEENFYFLLNLNKPIRQGQTQYYYLICNFKADQHIELEFNQTQEFLDQRYQGLQNKMEGPLIHVFAQLIKSLCGASITVPGKFVSSQNKKSFDVSLGAKTGPMFLLNHSLLFVQKPIVHVHYDNIYQLNIHWLDERLANRNFDLEVITKDSEKYLFSSIDWAESEHIIKFFQEMGIKPNMVQMDSMVNSESEDLPDIKPQDKKSQDGDQDEEEEEDDDFDPNKSDSEESEDEAMDYSEEEH